MKRNMEIHSSDWKKANGRFYALASKCHMSSDDVHATIFSAYGKTHTNELSPAQLNSLCDSLKDHAIPEHEQRMDRLRKRVLGAVRKYCKEMGYQTDNFYLLQVIQRGGKRFNEMTEAELMRKYNTFNKMAQELVGMRTNPTITIPINASMVMGEA